MTELTTAIAKTNARLRSLGVRVTIEQRGSKLSLRAVLLPKPGSGKDKPFQQYLSLGVQAYNSLKQKRNGWLPPWT